MNTELFKIMKPMDQEEKRKEARDLARAVYLNTYFSDFKDALDNTSAELRGEFMRALHDRNHVEIGRLAEAILHGHCLVAARECWGLSDD